MAEDLLERMGSRCLTEFTRACGARPLQLALPPAEKNKRVDDMVEAFRLSIDAGRVSRELLQQLALVFGKPMFASICDHDRDFFFDSEAEEREFVDAIALLVIAIVTRE